MRVEHLRNRPDRMRLPYVVCRDLQRIGKRSRDRRQLQHLSAGSTLSVTTELRVVGQPSLLLLLILALGIGLGCSSTLPSAGGSGGKGGSGTGVIGGQGSGGGQAGGGAGGRCAACQSGAAACPAGVSAGALCSGNLQTCCVDDVQFQCGCNSMNCAWSPICEGTDAGAATGTGGSTAGGGSGGAQVDSGAGCAGLDEVGCTARSDCRADYCPLCQGQTFVGCARPSDLPSPCAGIVCPQPCSQVTTLAECETRSDCRSSAFGRRNGL